MKGISLENALEYGKSPLPREGFDGGICPPPQVKYCKGVVLMKNIAKQESFLQNIAMLYIISITILSS